MPEMHFCSVSRCGAPTSLRCDCCGRPFCSVACSQAAWAEHCSGGGEPSRSDGAGGGELPAPASIVEGDKVASKAPARAKSTGEEEAAPAAEASEEAAAPRAGAGKENGPGAALMCAYPPCDLPRIGFCTRCLLVGWCSVAHQKAHWKEGHKAVCLPAETRLVPVLSWEQRVMAEAKAAAPASLAAAAKLAPISYWDFIRDGAPPTATLKAWHKKAEGGHSEAQCLLGYCYEFGIGVAQEKKFAVVLYAKAAVQGHASAQYSLGLCYTDGNGVAKDDRLAVECFAKAAAQGHSDAQFNLGLFYDYGTGVAQDYKLAVEWYTKAATLGHVKAQYSLGAHYERGIGVAQDFKRAADWHGKAAAQGVTGAVGRRDACLARLAADASAGRA